jgi:hypothetical protein
MKIQMALIAAILAATPALARHHDDNAGYGHPRAILFSKTGFRGHSVTVDDSIGKLSSHGMDDKASSIMVQGGRWQVCIKDEFDGRCAIVNRSVPDLAALGIDQKISSIRLIGPGGPGGPGQPPRY